MIITFTNKADTKLWLDIANNLALRVEIISSRSASRCRKSRDKRILTIGRLIHEAQKEYKARIQSGISLIMQEEANDESHHR